MSIKARFALLLGLLLLGFAAALAWLRHLEGKRLAEILAGNRETRAQLLEHGIDFTGRALPQFANDVAQSEEFVRLLAQAGGDAARERIEAAMQAAGVHALWIQRGDGSVRLRFPAGAAPAEPPLAGADFVALVGGTPGPRFFAELGGGLHEIAIRRLPAADAVRAEWVTVARRWDDAQRAAIASLTESEVTLHEPRAIAQPPPDPARIVLVRPLPDWRGRPLRVMRVEHRDPALTGTLAADWRSAQVFFAFGLLLIAAAALALHAWVLRPLGRIGDSLAHDDPAPALLLVAQKTELGRIAQLVVASFAQRETLRQEIEERHRAQIALENSEAALRANLEERERLGRDLHDGVIQSLYAAGMGLAGIRALLRPEQTEALNRLEQTRRALNETVHDVRNFIIGLEPEALKLQTFSQAVVMLLESMQGMRSFRSLIDIDDGLAARLSLAQRVHALQIAREAVSNALRHGEAGEVRVALRRAGEAALFEVIDTGRGFDATASAHGHGLGNFEQRARELGAELSVESQPGRGTRVKLVFALSNL